MPHDQTHVSESGTTFAFGHSYRWQMISQEASQ